MDRLRGIPLVLAGWLRYRMAVDDEGRPMELSPDPMAERLGPHMEKLRLGGAGDGGKRTEWIPGPRGPWAAEVKAVLRPILSDKAIFGVDLFAAGLAGRVTELFMEMAAGPGRVRGTLHSLVKGEM